MDEKVNISPNDTLNKTTKRPFITRLCEKKGCTVKEASVIYEMFIATLMDEILAGNKVILTGFGDFMLKSHKGHKIRFSKNDVIDEYLTLKFSASNTLNRQLRESSNDLLETVKNYEKKTKT